MFVKKPGENAAAGLFAKGFGRIEIVVVGKRGLFIEGLHDAGNIGLFGRPVVLPEELRDSSIDGKLMGASFAADLVWKSGQCSAANGAGERDF